MPSTRPPEPPSVPARNGELARFVPASPGAAAVRAPEDSLAVLRDLDAPPRAREEAWGEVVRWLHQAHYAPSLEARLQRRLVGQGMAGRVAAADVFSRFCFRVRARPGLLGQRPVPSRSWLRQAMERECRELERTVRRQDRDRAGGRSAEEATRLLEGLPTPDPAAPPEPDQSFLGSPETAALLRELQEELERELRRLEDENPGQHAALTLSRQGTPYAQIGARLATSVGNVKSLVSRARETLRARLAGYLDPKGGGREPR